ncbi:hypothetical protein O6H91_17G018100 [Diphasiastrum complanatum]|uniref:Uncharacterized protein n=1 Tax=Diphasiastrum complanatum TaxID=34168 RepID=A0ACC2B4R7_DIPCM|nr:hypothetical protein O6H91_17G018100 [Diphasiastrum complanatum]
MTVESGAWNSVGLEVLYQALGWFAFTVWTFSFYPQVLLNFSRKSVVGLNFDFVLFNLTKQSSYFVYNASLFFSPLIQRQYHEKYGKNQLIPVAPSDVAFSTHAVLVTIFIVFQVYTYERGTQQVSRTGIFITVAAWVSAIVCLIIAYPTGDWLWLVSAFNTIQVVMTVIKYLPQALMNYRRKSTVGWSIGSMKLDLSGGTGNLLQMLVQTVDQASISNLIGNAGKLVLCLVVITFDLIFIFQHYVLYNGSESLDSKCHLLFENDVEDPIKPTSKEGEQKISEPQDKLRG